MFRSSVLCAVAGCKEVTLRAWRNRNGLFPETLGKAGCNRFSVLDICWARTVVVLTEHGLGADDAVRLVQAGFLPLRWDLERILEQGPDQSRIVGFMRGEPVPKRKAMVFREDGTMTPATPDDAPAKLSIFRDGGGETTTLREALADTSGAITFFDFSKIVRFVLFHLDLHPVQAVK